MWRLYETKVIVFTRGDLVCLLLRHETATATHDATWARRDSFCKNQYALSEQPEEFPSTPEKTVIRQLPELPRDLSFEKYNFSKEDGWDE